MAPDGWQEKVLGQIFEFKNGLNTEKEQYGDGYKFVNVMDVFRNDVITEPKILGRVQVTENQLKEYKLKFGDVLFNRTSETYDEIAMSAVYLDNAVATFGGFVIRGRPIDDSVFPNYSVYAFQSSGFRKQVIKLGQGAVRANIGQKDLSKVRLLLPPSIEQKKIAQILSTWDKSIATTEKLLKNSQKQKLALMQQLLTGKKRFPGFSCEWTRVQLKNILREEKERNKNCTVNRVLSVTNHSGFVLPEDQFYKRVASEDVSNYKVVRNGQFGYNPSRINVGSFARLDEYKEGLLSPMYVIFSVNKADLNSDLFLEWMSSGEAKSRIASSTQGSVRESVGFDALCAIHIWLPPLKEQLKIVSVLNINNREIILLKQKLEHLKQEKKALMQQLLTGKRRVKV